MNNFSMWGNNFTILLGIFTNWLGNSENTGPQCAEEGKPAGGGKRGLLHILRDLAELRLPSPALFEGSVRIACA